jgi:hypothetical protein
MSSLLIVMAVIFAVVEFAPRSRAVELVVALLVNLLSSRLNYLSPRVAHRLLRVALFTLPSYERDDQFDEWIDHLDAIGGSGLQTLISAAGLIVRGLPRLACRSRLRQALNALVPVGPGQIFVCDDRPERTLWLVQGSPEKPIRLTFTATRYPVGVTRLWRVAVFYFALIRADDPPEITRHAVVISRLFPGALRPLVKRMGYAASNRRFAEAEILDLRQESGQPIPRAEIDRILNAGGRTTTKSVKMSPQRRSARDLL